MNSQIIGNPFNENINLYKEQYPKRNIYISQTLSTCEITFLGKSRLAWIDSEFPIFCLLYGVNALNMIINITLLKTVRRFHQRK